VWFFCLTLSLTQNTTRMLTIATSCDTHTHTQQQCHLLVGSTLFWWTSFDQIWVRHFPWPCWECRVKIASTCLIFLKSYACHVQTHTQRHTCIQKGEIWIYWFFSWSLNKIPHGHVFPQYCSFPLPISFHRCSIQGKIGGRGLTFFLTSSDLKRACS